MKHVRIATFHRTPPGPMHVATKFSGGPKAKTTMCGAPVAGMRRVPAPDGGDRMFFRGMCPDCDDLFQF